MEIVSRSMDFSMPRRGLVGAVREPPAIRALLEAPLHCCLGTLGFWDSPRAAPVAAVFHACLSTLVSHQRLCIWIMPS